jgi:HK97 family phage prohead protease
MDVLERSGPRPSLRAVPDSSPGAARAGRTLVGHLAVFNRWATINSALEGHFLERVAPGAFRASLARSQPKILLNHGSDPQLGDKPIAVITELREDDIGAYYEAPLLDGVPDLVVDGLAAGLYGASFRFTVERDSWERQPERSAHNPEGLPERTLTEVNLMEFGPVTWPAYGEATAGLRSASTELAALIGELDAFLGAA